MDYYHVDTHWAAARKLNDLRESLFALTQLSMECGCEEYGTIRYERCFNLASAFRERIIKKWGRVSVCYGLYKEED